jgi:tetratricopeptide (TPR) repeat protein
VQWITHAIAYSREQLPPQNSFDRDEALEMYRAVRTGALALTALYLRHGDADRAADAIGADTVSRVASPNLQEALALAAEGRPDAWYELFKTYDSYIDETSSDAPIGRELARGASWGSALELYRTEPSTFRGVLPLVVWLARHWMSEAAIPIIVPVALSTDDPRVLSWALNYVLQAVVSEDSTNNIESARRVFAAADGILEHAQRGKHAARVNPSPTRLRFAMGAIETRVGALSRARELLAASAAHEPSVAAMKLLAAIDRQRGDHTAALEALDRVLALSTQAGDVTTVAEAHVSMFEIHRDLGYAPGAKDALDTALRRALDARQLAQTGPEQATAERILARILEHYGDADGARRATLRAYEASRQDVRQIAATALDASRRALTRGDLHGAREAAKRAVEGHVPDDDLVYVALWLKLVEARLRVPSDGTVEEVLAAADTNESWTSTLRAWGTGRLTDEALFKAASTVVERTEALFYSAMSTRGRGDEAAAMEGLERVASSEAIQLVEVTIARDLLAASKSVPPPPLPRDVEVP